jgi:hypothetical protein
MSQFSSSPTARTGGGLDVFTGLLCVATLVLLVGVALMAMRNMEHPKVGTTDGGMLTLVSSR